MSRPTVVSGPLLAALALAAPGGIPPWLTRPARCATISTPLPLTPAQQEELADLVAHAWWEALAAGDDGAPWTDITTHPAHQHLG